MLENLQNLKCFLPHESQKVLIYFKDTNLSNGHNCPWLKENNHLMFDEIISKKYDTL
jgi:hypothetical protein